MSDSYFDMPAEMNEADMDMASLEEAGNRHARRVRKFGEEGYRTMQAGGSIELPATSKATGEAYTVTVRLDETDTPVYSVDGRTWHDSAREAYAAAQDVFGEPGYNERPE